MKKSASSLLRELIRQSNPGNLECRVLFNDPENRINLPAFPSKDAKGKDVKDVIRWKKGVDWHYVVGTHAQVVNHFEGTWLKACEDGAVRYPKVLIHFKKANRILNLLEEPHRIFSAHLLAPNPEYHCLLESGKSFPESGKYKELYQHDPIKRTRAILQHSPISILFGGFAGQLKLSAPFKHTTLVEMEIDGISLDNQEGRNQITRIRQGAGSFLPPVAVREEKTPNPKNAKWSEIGLNSVPLNLDNPECYGAIALKDIVYRGDMILDRVWDLRIGTTEENTELKFYMISLWLYMFHLGCRSGFNHYRGRRLDIKEMSASFKCPFNLEIAKELSEALGNPVKNQETYKTLHDEALNSLTKMNLVTLSPLKLTACPLLDEEVSRSLISKKARKENEVEKDE